MASCGLHVHLFNGRLQVEFASYPLRGGFQTWVPRDISHVLMYSCTHVLGHNCEGQMGSEKLLPKLPLQQKQRTSFFGIATCSRRADASLDITPFRDADGATHLD